MRPTVTDRAWSSAGGQSLRKAIREHRARLTQEAEAIDALATRSAHSGARHRFGGLRTRASASGATPVWLGPPRRLAH